MDAGKRIRGLAAAALLGLALSLAAERPIAGAIGGLSLGEPKFFEGLTVIPLLGRASPQAAGCTTLEQALERGWLTIVEKDGGSVPEGQSGVWAEVARANDEAGVSSSTGAYQDAYRDGRVSRKIEELELADLARRHPQAVGAIVGLGGSIVSLDLFADPHLFRSTALVARGQQGKARVTRRQASELLALLAGADYRARETPDLGSAFAFRNERWDANALVLDGALLHLAAFPRQPEEAGGGEEPLDGTHRQRQYGE
jgi:hypothetical protein